jgi:predicted metal-dependent peptidase
MTLHCLFRHLAKRRGRDAVLWDLACDAAVESVIDSLPYACLSQRASPPKQQFLTECRRELKVLSAEGIYRLLLRWRLPEYKIASLQRLFAVDDHSLWDLEEKQERERSERQDQHWQNAASNAQTALDSLVSEHGAGGEGVTEQLSIAARDNVDYRKFLRRFAAPREILHADADAFDYIYYTYGLSRYGNMPLIEPPETREERRIEDLVIAIDTSMSTTGETVRAFLGTTYSILRTSESFTRKFNIRIIQCDDRVRSDTVITDASQLKAYMDRVTLSGGSATDFRPVFAHVEELRKQGALPALRGLLYFTDGMGIYPTHRTDYETAFILPEEPPLAYHVPPWAIRIVLDMAETDRATPEDWEDDLKYEMPEL